MSFDSFSRRIIYESQDRLPIGAFAFSSEVSVFSSILSFSGYCGKLQKFKATVLTKENKDLVNILVRMVLKMDL